jgi:hypothetical protein
MKICNSMSVQIITLVSVLKMFKTHHINLSLNGVFLPLSSCFISRGFYTNDNLCISLTKTLEVINSSP